jgi:hypothetical protein
VPIVTLVKFSIVRATSVAAADMKSGHSIEIADITINRTGDPGNVEEYIQANAWLGTGRQKP